MNKLKVIGIILVAIIALFFCIGFVLPSEVEVSRTTTINATPEAIFPHLISPKKMLAWSPWSKKDPNAKWTHEGPESGVGAKYSWEGNSDVGKGSQEITSVVENKEVMTQLDFGEEGPATAYFKLEPKGEQTQVEWGFKSDMGGPVGRWFGLLMDSFIGPDYEQGLANLKTIVEKGE